MNTLFNLTWIHYSYSQWIDYTHICLITSNLFFNIFYILPCFKMANLNYSVRASNDNAFKRLQEIARYNYQKFDREPELVDEFMSLCSEHLTFVNNWDDSKITPSTMRLYSKKVPAREASKQFVERVRRQINENSRIEKDAEDVEKNRYSHQEWSNASQNTSI